MMCDATCRNIASFVCFYGLVLASAALVGEKGLAAQRSAPSPKSVTVPPQSTAPLSVREWLAFGSGCKSSSKAGNKNLSVVPSKSEGLAAVMRLDDFILNVPSGGLGVRECALRLTVEPQTGFRIKDIAVKAQLEATKSDGVQLRSRVLLLVADSLIARQEWNIAPQEFARHRTQWLTLVPGVRSEMSMPQLPCGKSQIVGVDFTFEGLTHSSGSGVKANSENSILRAAAGVGTEISILAEKCR